MKVLFLILVLVVNAGPLMAQDGYDLSRDLQDSYSLDYVIKNGSDILVARWSSIKPANIPSPLGASAHRGSLQLVNRLYGKCPDIIDGTFFTFYDATKKIAGNPQQDFTPKAGDISLLIASYDPAQQKLHIRRFIQPTPANLELVSSLIREYKAKDLAASPEATTMLDQGLAAALSEAVSREKSSEAPVKMTRESIISSGNFMAVLAGFILALIAGWGVMIWKKRSHAAKR